ncbi:MAG: MotA/TolQ/ExbB proton channel family protein [Syntrophomonas sp.]|nr:MotA/TolQ/ExbB proton channel family protein [Syntrophomonas sp.]
MIFAMLEPLRETMHTVSSSLLAPTIIILLLLAAIIMMELGGLLVEIFTERRKEKTNLPELMESFQGKDVQEISAAIDNSNLFRRQKAALHELLKHRDLPVASRQALALRLVTNEELHYFRITNRTDVVARLGPMLGLMATLIPLGPGLIALGQGDTKTLADSLLTAFDATVTGLAAAAVAFAISRLRKRWYEDYLSSLETLLESLLEVFAGEPRIAE